MVGHGDERGVVVEKPGTVMVRAAEAEGQLRHHVCGVGPSSLLRSFLQLPDERPER